jgi:hypothetical protein
LFVLTLLATSFAQTFVAAILTAPDGLFMEQRTGRIEFPEISSKILEKVLFRAIVLL